jgi:hypothetical protein
VNDIGADLNKPLPQSVNDKFRQSSTATTTTQRFAPGLRNTRLAGLAAARNLRHNRMVGEAFTLRYIAAREDLDVLGEFEDPDYPAVCRDRAGSARFGARCRQRGRNPSGVGGCDSHE